MKKIKIFLASSNELKPEREQFEIEINRKNNAWFNKEIFLQLNIWEDMSARMSSTGSQSEYNKFVEEADIFVFLAYSKVGMYTAEEFEHAFGHFQATQKPFIFTYFKTPPANTEDSLAEFKTKLRELKHYGANFTDSNDLWNQFNKELEHLELEGFEANYWDKTWILSLRSELVNMGVKVGNKSIEIIQQYGWLVSALLSKMCTEVGQETNLRGLSFMTEAYQGSLRYLCYIQMAQILQMENKPKLDIVSDFIKMEGTRYQDFDYTNLLLSTTAAIGQTGFVKEINKFTEELANTDSDLYGYAKTLEDQRRKLLANSIPEEDKIKLRSLLDKYLAALVYWLRKISFLARYQLVSVKEINLNYRLGTSKKFLHKLGELHGSYTRGDLQVENSFTFNKSILLFKGNDLATSMANIQDQNSYLSLSPLVIDQSAYGDDSLQTPEIFYYTGYEKPEDSKRRYSYAKYTNELVLAGMGVIKSNDAFQVFDENIEYSWRNDLFAELEVVFKTLKSKTV
jgi:hypothetical protein